MPDLLCGWRGKNFLLEVKNPEGRNRVEDAQTDFHTCWRGQSAYVRNSTEAIEIICGPSAIQGGH